MGPSTHAVGKPFVQAPNASAADARPEAAIANSAITQSRNSRFMTPPPYSFSLAGILAPANNPQSLAIFRSASGRESILSKPVFSIKKISDTTEDAPGAQICINSLFEDQLYSSAPGYRLCARRQLETAQPVAECRVKATGFLRFCEPMGACDTLDRAVEIKAADSFRFSL